MKRMARDGGDDWVEGRLYRKEDRISRVIRLGIRNIITYVNLQSFHRAALISKYTATHFLDPFDDAT